MVKKGFLFSIDALIASIIIVFSILIFSQLYITKAEQTHLSLLSNDALEVLSELKVCEIDNPYVAELIADGEITNLNNTLLEQLGEFWATNRTDIARLFASNITENLFPENMGFSLVYGNEEVFGRTFPGTSQVVASRKMVSGYEKDKPVKGSTSRAYLKSITSKKSYAYAYFGGFVGQGELFTQLEYIPSDAEIIDARIEADAASSFAVYVNDVHCADASVSGSKPNMSSEIFNISSCDSEFKKGVANNISIKFPGADINDDYISGGSVRVTYLTQKFVERYPLPPVKQYLPGIKGVSNLYSSFYVPGNLTSMDIYLHYKSDYPTYLTIGDRTIYQDNGSLPAEHFVNIENATLSSFPIQLDYTGLSKKTIPIRFASYNNSYETILEGGNADVVLITDLSGSMKYRMDSWSNPGNAIPNCRESDILDSSSRRLGVAACLDSEFNAIVMNDSFLGNRLWLVDFSDNANPFFSNDLTELTRANIENQITDEYKSRKQSEISGGTCLCCAINQAYNILQAYSSPERTKAVLVMTDGVPTHCCGGYWQGFSYKCNETGTSTNGKWPLLISSCKGDVESCTEPSCNGPMNNAINSAQRLHDDLNATIYSTGFGPIDTCENANYTLRKIAEKGNGTFYLGSDASALRDFYRSVGYSILQMVNMTSQQILVKGNVTFSELYPDSYIQMYYAPLVDEPEFGEIAFVFQTPQLKNCSSQVDIPKKIRILEAKVTSFSGPHWTKNVTVNGNPVFLLEDFNTNFGRLGDPFIIYAPPGYFVSGNNTITIDTGDNPNNSSGCSQNNSLIYMGAVKTSTAYSTVLDKAEGCHWQVQNEDDQYLIFEVPASYTGNKTCNFSTAFTSYDQKDSIDQSTYELLKQLDFDDDSKIDVNINDYDFQIEALWVSQVPYLWGPAIAEVRLWQ